MTFLHPSQARLVTRTFRGPARLRGATGTGKTSVALHRAARLARQGFAPMLYATDSKTLPGIFRELFKGLAPGAADHVEFDNIYGWAAACWGRVGWRRRSTGRPWLGRSTRHGSGGRRDRAGDAANAEEVLAGEISGVKGGGLRVFDDYAKRLRVGRNVAINLAQRERC